MSYLKRNDTHELIYKTETDHQLKEQIYSRQQVRMGQRDKLGSLGWDRHVHTAVLIFQMDKQGPTIPQMKLFNVM